MTCSLVDDLFMQKLLQDEEEQLIIVLLVTELLPELLKIFSI
jgi:hypothetical protein